MKTSLNLENPKRFPELLLFFGMVLVFMGSGVEAFTTNATMTTDGWIVVVIAILLWVHKTSKNRRYGY